jgi:hypothetical protein
MVAWISLPLVLFVLMVGLPLVHAWLHRGEDTVFPNNEGR